MEPWVLSLLIGAAIVFLLLWFGIPLLRRGYFLRNSSAVSNEEFLQGFRNLTSAEKEEMLAMRNRAAKTLKLPASLLAPDTKFKQLIRIYDVVEQGSILDELYDICPMDEENVTEMTIQEWCARAIRSAGIP